MAQTHNTVVVLQATNAVNFVIVVTFHASFFVQCAGTAAHILCASVYKVEPGPQFA